MFLRGLNTEGRCQRRLPDATFASGKCDDLHRQGSRRLLALAVYLGVASGVMILPLAYTETNSNSGYQK